MITEKQTAYINSLIADNRNVQYLNGDASDNDKARWIVASLGMKSWTFVNPDDEDAIDTTKLHTLSEWMDIRNAKISEIESNVTGMDSKQASAAIDTLKRMLGRR